MFPSDSERLQNELRCLAEARTKLSQVTGAIVDDLVIFKRKPAETEKQFKSAVMAQRTAYKGIKVELNRMNSDSRQKAEEQLIRVLVKTQ